MDTKFAWATTSWTLQRTMKRRAHIERLMTPTTFALEKRVVSLHEYCLKKEKEKAAKDVYS